MRADSTTIGTGDHFRMRRITRHAVFVRQPQVDQQQVGLVRARLDLATLTVARLDDPVVLRLEQHAQDRADAGLIFDDQDLVHRLRHGAASATGNVNSNRAPPRVPGPAVISPP